MTFRQLRIRHATPYKSIFVAVKGMISEETDVVYFFSSNYMNFSNMS